MLILDSRQSFIFKWSHLFNEDLSDLLKSLKLLNERFSYSSLFGYHWMATDTQRLLHLHRFF
jgi:hypothetical protein